VNAAYGLGAAKRVTTRAGAKGRAEVVVEKEDGAKKIVAFGDDGAWSVRDEPAAPAAAVDATHHEGDAGHAVDSRADSDGAAALPAELSHLPPGAPTTVGDVNGDSSLTSSPAGATTRGASGATCPSTSLPRRRSRSRRRRARRGGRGALEVRSADSQRPRRAADGWEAGRGRA
jgi:hypothetical protein